MFHPSMRRAACSLAFAAAVVASAPAAAITTTIHDFIVTKNGAPFFLDSFNDGVAPPSSPAFASGTLHTYYVGGQYLAGSETGGHLTVNSLNGQLGSSADGSPARTQRATVLSNSDPLNTTNGLKINHNFAASSLVDIAGASGAGSFGVRFSDRITFQNGSSSVSEFVSVDFLPSSHIVRLRRQDFVADTVTNISSIPVPVAADQVRLMLLHPVGNVGLVYAAAEFFDDGESMGVFAVPGAASIFNYNGFTRAEFAAGETLPIPEPETYAMMLVGIGLVGWQLRRKAKAGRAQYLA